MICIQRLFVIFAIAVSTCSVGTSDGVRLRGMNYKVETLPAASDGGRARTSKTRYVITVDNTAVLLHWTVSAYHHTDQPDITADVAAAATVVQRIGQVRTSANHTVARSSISDGREKTEVVLGVAGRGQVRVDLATEMDPRVYASPLAAAGTYENAVTLTVTAN